MIRMTDTIRKRRITRTPQETTAQRLERAKARDVARLYGTRIWL
jgi:hypothetical protein